MKLDIEEYIHLTRTLSRIANTPLEHLELYKDGQKIEVDSEFVDEWKGQMLDTTFAIAIILGRMV